MPSLWQRLTSNRHRYKQQRKSNIMREYMNDDECDDDDDDCRYNTMFHSLANLCYENDLSPSKSHFDQDEYRRMQFSSTQNIANIQGRHNVYRNKLPTSPHPNFKNGILNNATSSRIPPNSDDRSKYALSLLRKKNKNNNSNNNSSSSNNTKKNKPNFFDKFSSRKNKPPTGQGRYLIVPADRIQLPSKTSELSVPTTHTLPPPSIRCDSFGREGQVQNICVNYVSTYSSNNKNNSSNNNSHYNSNNNCSKANSGGYPININEYVPKSFRHLTTSSALRGHQVISDGSYGNNSYNYKYNINKNNNSGYKNSYNNNNSKTTGNYCYDSEGLQPWAICTRLQDPTENIISGEFVLAKRNYRPHHHGRGGGGSVGGSSVGGSISDSSGGGEELMSLSSSGSSVFRTWNLETKNEDQQQHQQQQQKGANQQQQPHQPLQQRRHHQHKQQQGGTNHIFGGGGGGGGGGASLDSDDVEKGRSYPTTATTGPIAATTATSTTRAASNNNNNNNNSSSSEEEEVTGAAAAVVVDDETGEGGQLSDTSSLVELQRQQLAQKYCRPISSYANNNRQIKTELDNLNGAIINNDINYIVNNTKSNINSNNAFLINHKGLHKVDIKDSTGQYRTVQNNSNISDIEDTEIQIATCTIFVTNTEGEDRFLY